jgi:hypothetical protein
MPAISPSPILLTHVVAAAAASLALTVWPPADGPMLLVPLGGGIGTAVRAATGGGGRILAAGPLPGSLVVEGERSRIAAAAPGWRMVIVAAPAAACGATGTGTVQL